MINFVNELEKLFKLPFSEVSKGFKVILLDKGFFIEGHSGIKNFSDTEIVFNIKKGTLNIFGNNLIIKNLDKDTAFISGTVIKVERGG